MRVLLLLLLVVAAASAETRIVGGSNAAIGQYPFLAALVFSSSGSGTFYQTCVGSIVRPGSIVTVAHCLFGFAPAQWRARVGSATSNTGGRLYNFNRINTHPSFNSFTYDSDIALVYTTANIAIGGNVQLGHFAGPQFTLPDNTAVWSAGWGVQNFGGPHNNQLRHVNIWTVNQAVCNQRYTGRGRFVTDNMLCSGWLDIGGRDTCIGGSGSPLLHNNVVVGLSSWAYRCATPRYPRVNTRIPRFINWIQQNV